MHAVSHRRSVQIFDGSPLQHPFWGVSILVRSGQSVSLIVVGVADRSALRATGATRILRGGKHPFSANQRRINYRSMDCQENLLFGL